MYKLFLHQMVLPEPDSERGCKAGVEQVAGIDCGTLPGPLSRGCRVYLPLCDPGQREERTGVGSTGGQSRCLQNQGQKEARVIGLAEATAN